MNKKVYRLKVTKKKLYKLAGKYAHVDVKLKETGFTKSGSDYFLDFWQDGEQHHFFFAACEGGAGAGPGGQAPGGLPQI